jgi:hypothetical protein
MATAIAMALGQEQQEQWQWQWGKRNGATGQLGNGDGDDQLIDWNGATAALGQGPWGRSNRSKSNFNREWAINGDGDVYFLLSRINDMYCG